MTPNWHTYWQVFSAPWRQRKTGKSYWGLVAIAVLLLAMTFLLVWIGKRKGLFLGVGMSTAILAIWLWITQILGALQHNHPVHVRLVPGYLQAQRRVLLAVWLGCTVLQTPAVWTFLGPLPAAALPTELRSLVVAFLVSATGLMLFAMLFRWVWLAALSMLIGPWLSPILNRLPDVSTSAQEVALAHAHWIGAALLATFAWLLTHRILRNGSAAHRAAHTFRAELSGAWTWDPTQKTPPFMTSSSRVRKWLWLFSYPYLRYSRWVLESAQLKPRSVMARVDMGLMGPNHWVKQLTDAVGFIAVAVVLYAFMQSGEKTGRGQLVVSGALWGTVLGFALTLFGGLRNGMLRSQRAHGLLVLLPGMPHGAVLNHALARRHLVQVSLRWAIMFLAILAFPWPATVRSSALLVWIAYLPALAFAIQDWSRVGVLTRSKLMLRGGIFSIGIPIVLSAHFWLDMPWQHIALAAAALCVGISVWRWRKLAGYPQALPAGRLAQ